MQEGWQRLCREGGRGYAGRVAEGIKNMLVNPISVKSFIIL